MSALDIGTLRAIGRALASGEDAPPLDTILDQVEHFASGLVAAQHEAARCRNGLATAVASFEYGDMVPYPEDGDGSAGWPAWHDALMSELERAPEVAWSSDILSCEACGYHYHVAHGCCEREE